MTITKAVEQAIWKEIEKDALACTETCYDFELKWQPFDLSMLFVRYIRVDASDPSNIDQKYRWVCFNRKGKRTDCDPVFASVDDERAYKKAMITISTKKYQNELSA